MHFWDWRTGYNFQKLQTTVQPGSLDSEAGIFQCCFDASGCRLLTAEADKTIKIYKEDDTAVSAAWSSTCLPSFHHSVIVGDITSCLPNLIHNECLSAYPLCHWLPVPR